MPILALPSGLGKSNSDYTVLRWRKRAGEAFHQGDVLLELEGDDGLAEVTAPAEGVLGELAAQVGARVMSGAPLAAWSGGSAMGESALSGPSVPPTTTAGPSTAKNLSAAPSAPVAPPTTLVPSSVVPVLMPKAGQSMEEGVIVKWRVQPGAVIQKGMVIFEIETDKATMEVEATDAGRLARIVVAEGGSCQVQRPVAFLADRDEDVDAYLASHAGMPAAGMAEKPIPSTPEASAPAARAESVVSAAPPGPLRASPAARKLARERGIDLSAVAKGSGPSGRILSTDVPTSVAEPALPAQLPAAAKAVAGAAPLRKRLSGMRKAIARNLTLSKTTIPHWYLRSRLNAGPMMTLYRSQKAKVGCSLNDLIVMACARAIMEFPAFRSRVDGDALLEFDGANIGIAVGLDDGLVVPVVLHAEALTLADLAAETKRLANQARAGRIENMGQGVFTISNLGMFGVDEFLPIINPPEAAILGVGAVREDILVQDGAIRAGQTLTLTLSSDHRVIDGTLGAQFMARLKALLESPVQLIA